MPNSATKRLPCQFLINHCPGKHKYRTNSTHGDKRTEKISCTISLAISFVCKGVGRGAHTYKVLRPYPEADAIYYRHLHSHQSLQQWYQQRQAGFNKPVISNRTLFDLNNIDIERRSLLSVSYIAIPSNWTSKPKLSCQSSPFLKKEADKLFPTILFLRTEAFKIYDFLVTNLRLTLEKAHS